MWELYPQEPEDIKELIIYFRISKYAKNMQRKLQLATTTYIMPPILAMKNQNLLQHNSILCFDLILFSFVFKKHISIGSEPS